MKLRSALRAPLLLFAATIAPLAQAEVVVVVAADSALAPTVEQICQVYLGKIKAPTPISLGEQHPVRDEFYSKICKKDPAQVRAIWGKLIFTGTGTPPKEVASSGEMKKAVAANKTAVGYLDKKDIDASVKVIATTN